MTPSWNTCDFRAKVELGQLPGAERSPFVLGIACDIEVSGKHAFPVGARITRKILVTHTTSLTLYKYVRTYALCDVAVICRGVVVIRSQPDCGITASGGLFGVPLGARPPPEPPSDRRAGSLT